MKTLSSLVAPKSLVIAAVLLFGSARCGGGTASPGSSGQQRAGGTIGGRRTSSSPCGRRGSSRERKRVASSPEGGVGPSFDGSAGGDDTGVTEDGGTQAMDAADQVDSGQDRFYRRTRQIVGGYYPNWTPSPVRIRDVDPHYNLIYLFAATPVGGSPGTGAIEWTPPGDGLGAATISNADIAYARQTQGRKIIMSVGGAGNDMSFPNRTTSQAFVSSVAALYSQLGGFDGIDWDTYEGSDSPDTTEMIWISQQLKSMYPGFLITTPPAPWSTVDQTFCSQMAAAGALDYAAPQYYDGPNLATQAYIVPNVNTWTNLLGEGMVVVGFGIADATNYMTVAQVISTWGAVSANHPNIRGAFDWQIDVDQSTGWPFATQVGPLINP